MKNIELIARVICQHGQCEKCDADCIDREIMKKYEDRLKRLEGK